MSIRKEVTIGDCRLILGDCLEIIPQLEGIGAILTDPPFGLGDKMQGGTWGANEKYKKMREWDRQAPNLDFLLKLNVPSIIWGGNYFALPLSRCWLVWNKHRRNMTMADGELAWCSWDGNLRICDIYEPNGTYTRYHPTQKHLGLIEWCIKQLPEYSGAIVDCYLGSGTTGVACAKMGRKFIGIEIDETYFDIACKRIVDAYRQPDMFTPPVTKPEQLSL